MKNVYKIVFIIIGTLIGAGFASGREIYLFFGRFGVLGQIGIIVSAILTGYIIYKTLEIVQENKIDTYKEFINKINKKYIKANKIINLIVNAFLLVSFYIMIAGFSAYIMQIYNIPPYISSTLFTFICYFVFLKNIEGMIKANEILVPILVFFIIYLGIKNVPYLIESKARIYIDTLDKRMAY